MDEKEESSEITLSDLYDNVRKIVDEHQKELSGDSLESFPFKLKATLEKLDNFNSNKTIKEKFQISSDDYFLLYLETYLLGSVYNYYKNLIEYLCLFESNERENKEKLLVSWKEALTELLNESNKLLDTLND